MANKRYRRICSFTFEGEPYTKSNQAILKRKGRFCRMTYPARIMDYESNLADYAKKVCEKQNITPFAGPVRLKLIYYLRTRRRKDLQNLPKTTADALIGSVYEDDSWVVEIHMKKLYDPDKPRVEIQADEVLTGDRPYSEIYPLTSNTRSTTKKNKISAKASKRIKKKRAPRRKAVKRTRTSNTSTRSHPSGQSRRSKG